MPDSRRTRRLTIVLFLLALVLRIGWLAFTRPTPWSDYEDYRRIAEGMLDFHQFGYPDPTARRLPGQPVLLALLMVAGRSDVWLSFGQAVVAALTAAVAFRTSLAITNERAALGAGAAVAISPTLVMMSPVLASEHLATLLILLAVALVLRGSLSTARLLLCGLLGGAAVLTRGDALFFLPVLAAVVFVRATDWRARIVAPLVIAVAASLVVMPWYVRNRQTIGPGASLSTNGGLLFYFAHNPQRYGIPNRRGTPLQGLDDVTAQRRGFELGLDYLRAKPTRAIKDAVTGTKRLYSPSDYAVEASVRLPRGEGENDWVERPLPGRRLWSLLAALFYLVSLPLAAVALVALLRYAVASQVAVYGLLIMNWVCYGVIFMATARYRFTSEVIISALAGATVATLLSRMGRPAATTPQST